MWAVLLLVNVQLPLLYCLLFGALISPTDPIRPRAWEFSIPTALPRTSIKAYGGRD